MLSALNVDGRNVINGIWAGTVPAQILPNIRKENGLPKQSGFQNKKGK